MMRSWARRAALLHRGLGELADLGGDPRWWLLAGGAAVGWQPRASYVISDAEPASDTFIGHVVREPDDPVSDAIARAYAARDAIRALDGRLPDQRLAATLRRTAGGAVSVPSQLDVVAFAVGDRTWSARLDGDDAAIARDLAWASGAPDHGYVSHALQPLGAGPAPFVCVTLGEEPIETARHCHRRAWLANGEAVGPWLGLSRTVDVDSNSLAVVSTSHFAIDGFGHAWLAAEIDARVQARLQNVTVINTDRRTAGRVERRAFEYLPVPAMVPTAMPLGIAWRALDAPVKALPLAYALGCALHRLAGQPDARFSPTFQIPVAPGALDDGERRKRRVVPAIASVRFDRGTPEPYDTFAARAREMLAREADGSGLAAQLLAAAQGAPAPLAWKRRAVGPARPRWLESVASLIGGRGCVSRIHVDARPIAPSCAVSSPARIATDADPLGGCVVTVLDDGTRAAITVCGSGIAGTERAAAALLDELIANIGA